MTKKDTDSKPDSNRRNRTNRTRNTEMVELGPITHTHTQTMYAAYQKSI